MNHFMVLLAVIATQFAQLSITHSSGEKRGKCQKLAKKPSLLKHYTCNCIICWFSNFLTGLFLMPCIQGIGEWKEMHSFLPTANVSYSPLMNNWYIQKMMVCIFCLHIVCLMHTKVNVLLLQMKKKTSRCMTITEKVAFINVASEASYVYALVG